MEGIPEFLKPLWGPPRMWVQAATQAPTSLLPSVFACPWGGLTRGPRGQNSPPSTGGTPTSKKTALEHEGLAVGQLQIGGTFWKVKAWEAEACRGGQVSVIPSPHPLPSPQMEGCSAHGLWEHPTPGKVWDTDLGAQTGPQLGPLVGGGQGAGSLTQWSKGECTCSGVNR